MHPCYHGDREIADSQFLACFLAAVRIISFIHLTFLLAPLPACRLGGRIFTDIHGTVERTKRLMGPLVEERLEQERLHGRDWPGKPVTILPLFIVAIFSALTALAAE